MRGALVDPGGDLDRLKDAVRRAGVTIEKILLTHGHIDHCGQAGMLADELGVPIEGPHEDDRYWIAKLEEDGQKYGINGAPFEPSRWLVDGDSVTVGDLTLDVRHCPGHTPGHVVFHHAPSKLAMVGDVLFQGSMGRTDFPLGNHQDLIDSITQRLWPMGGRRPSSQDTGRCRPSPTSGRPTRSSRIECWRGVEQACVVPAFRYRALSLATIRLPPRGSPMSWAQGSRQFFCHLKHRCHRGRS